jgi:hypothetical protein
MLKYVWKIDGSLQCLKLQYCDLLHIVDVKMMLVVSPKHQVCPYFYKYFKSIIFLFEIETYTLQIVDWNITLWRECAFSPSLSLILFCNNKQIPSSPFWNLDPSIALQLWSMLLPLT